MVLSDFFHKYNLEHRHTGIGLLTLEKVYYGKMEEVTGKRNEVLMQEFLKYPDRFKGQIPKAQGAEKGSFD